MKQIVRRSIEVMSGAGLAVFGAAHALADNNVIQGISTNPLGGTSLQSGTQIINMLFKVITTVGVVLFIILLLIGGIQYLGSFGNEDSTKKARQLILDAVIGLFIVLAAGGIASFVLSQFGISTFNF